MRRLIAAFLFTGCVSFTGPPIVEQDSAGLTHDLALIKRGLAAYVDTAGLSYENPKGILRRREDDWDLIDLSGQGLTAFTGFSGLTYSWSLSLKGNELSAVPAGLKGFKVVDLDSNHICDGRERQRCP